MTIIAPKPMMKPPGTADVGDAIRHALAERQLLLELAVDVARQQTRGELPDRCLAHAARPGLPQIEPEKVSHASMRPVL